MLQTTATRNSIRGLLLLKGMTVSGWARKNCYRENLVTGLISRFAGKSNRPHKGLSLEIIEKLEAETGIKICG